MQRTKIGVTHQPRHAMLTAGFSRFTEIDENTRRAINAVTRHERRANQAEEPGILLPAIRHRVLKPFVIAAGSHAEDPTPVRTSYLSRCVLMNSYTARTRLARDFVDIGTALRCGC